MEMFKRTNTQLGDLDATYLKKRIQESIKTADPTDKRWKHQSTKEAKLNHQAIEAYEIAFFVNFQPLMVKEFIKIMINQLNQGQGLH